MGMPSISRPGGLHLSTERTEILKYKQGIIIINGVKFLKPRFLKVGEEITGKYHNMYLGENKRLFRLHIGDEQIYLPRDVGISFRKFFGQGNDVFTIARNLFVYEIKPKV